MESGAPIASHIEWKRETNMEHVKPNMSERTTSALERTEERAQEA